MTRGQRLTFLAIAAAIAIGAIIVIGASGGDEAEEPTAQQSAPQQTTPAPTSEPEEASPQGTATPEPPPLLRPRRETRIEVAQGERVRFRVRSPQADHLHVHGYDLFKDVPAGETITMTFRATITGIFEIELEDSHQLLGELRVNP